MSVKNGSELLDRLLKDIISNSAVSYVSILPPEGGAPEAKDASAHKEVAFSLPRLIPLLQERIIVINPFTRMFLVEWITLLDSIPDLYLVTYLPAFLKGLFRFLSDTNQDVVTATQHVLERFLNEIKSIAKVKSEIIERRKERLEEAVDDSTSGHKSDIDELIGSAPEESNDGGAKIEGASAKEDRSSAVYDEDYDESDDDDDDVGDPLEEIIPGQDVYVDHPKILSILVSVLGEAPGR